MKRIRPTPQSTRRKRKIPRMEPTLGWWINLSNKLEEERNTEINKQIELDTVKNQPNLKLKSQGRVGSS